MEKLRLCRVETHPESSAWEITGLGFDASRHISAANYDGGVKPISIQ